MSPELVTTNVTTDSMGGTILGVETIHKIMVQERGDRSIESRNRNDPQLCKNSLGGIVFTSEIIAKNNVQERP